MPVFGSRSMEHIKQMHPDLAKVMTEAVRRGPDFTIICSVRGKADQEAAFAKGASKVHYPNSAHNPSPARACDIIPYPFVGYAKEHEKQLTAELKAIGAVVMQVSRDLLIPIRWGGGVPDKSFDWDLPHFELHPWRTYVSKAK